ncbi:hypothetical protein ACHAXH_002205 [Discostella pseudostelligera]
MPSSSTSPSASRSRSRERGEERHDRRRDANSSSGRDHRQRSSHSDRNGEIDEGRGREMKRRKEEEEEIGSGELRENEDGDRKARDSRDIKDTDRKRSRHHSGDDNGNDERRNNKKSSSSRHHHHSSSTKRRRRRRSYSSDSSSSSSSDNISSSSSDSSSSSSSSGRHRKRSKKSSKKSSLRHHKKSSSSRKKDQKKHLPTPSSTSQNQEVNLQLLSKLSKRNETLEEREARRAQRRAARITARFGYTPEDNPFRDPNLHETFSWKKRDEKIQQQQAQVGGGGGGGGGGDDGAATAAGGDHGKNNRRHTQDHTFAEIDKVRQRREARELHLTEMERLRAEESRIKELENYDSWARKEEEFHLQQQRQRSAIRLVEGREKPVDVLAQNMLLFGLSSEEKENRARVKYRERYSALEELETLELNLEEPYVLLKDLKLTELEELLVDIDAFRRLEREAVAASAADGGGEDNNNAVIRYWDALHTVTLDEIQYLKTGGTSGGHASLVGDIRNMFTGQSVEALLQMKDEIERKLRGGGDAPRFDEDGVIDTEYWTTVLDQLKVHMAKIELSEIHSKMLVRQLEKLEVKREELRKKSLSGGAATNESAEDAKEEASSKYVNVAASAMPLPQGVEPDFGNLEEELGLNDEFDLHIYDAAEGGVGGGGGYAWQDKYRPRKPRYFNRVKTGYDWNAYNKTHYDHDNPPPKIVQGYKFNVFYPDLIDKTKTPQYLLEKADTDEFCILRFSAGPPYEDIAFKIINRQWNKSRKSGFRCTFERGVLSLYFNFASHWYRR